jgi:hypothetical protein
VYIYEEGMRAVELYIKWGKRLRATLRELKRDAWTRSHSDVVMKTTVVGLYSRHESAQALAEKVGVSVPTLHAWKNQLLG